MNKSAHNSHDETMRTNPDFNAYRYLNVASYNSRLSDSIAMLRETREAEAGIECPTF